MGALLFWKRLRANAPWAAKLLSMREEEVRPVPVDAVWAVAALAPSVAEAARRGRYALSTSPAFKNGTALASALLTAAAATRLMRTVAG